MNALIIDDDKSLRWILDKILSKKFRVVAKNDGIAGLAWLSEGNIPDIIITDMNLPKMNGLELLQSLKMSGAYKDIPVVIISGENNDDLMNQCIEEGALKFLRKPFDPEELNSIIEGIFEKKKRIPA